MSLGSYVRGFVPTNIIKYSLAKEEATQLLGYI
jgi:hypothetical protein